MVSIFYNGNLRKKINYPTIYNSARLWKTAIKLWSALFLFLLLYRPFGVYDPELRFSYCIICALHAFSPAVIIYVYFSIVNYLRSQFYYTEWTYLREYCHLVIVILIVGLISFLMRGLIYNNPYNWTFRYLYEEIKNCYLAGILLYTCFLLVNIYERAKLISEPKMQDDRLVKRLYLKCQVAINTQVKQDDFSFFPDDLLFAKAEGNYMQLTTFRNQQLKTELKRITLSQFASQVAAHPFLFRCHRTYLVNLLQVVQFSGNSQGYLLSVKFIDDKVPVSRSLIKGFETQYSQFGGKAIA